MGWLSRSKSPSCEDLDQIGFRKSETDVCPDCVEGGTEWVHLRMCMVCGKPGCCSSSPMNHSARHFEETGHPLMTSLEPRENWAWCFADEVYLKPRDYL